MPIATVLFLRRLPVCYSVLRSCTDRNDRIIEWGLCPEICTTVAAKAPEKRLARVCLKTLE